MPILWKYLIGDFLKIAATCMAAFIAILLTMRLDDIAHFMALGASLSYVAFFTLCQIPYILPIALPLSCLIAAFLLIQRLCAKQELTALRACGFSLKDIFIPLLITASFLSILNFWITSELATQSHLQTNLLKSELRSVNPLLLLNNKHLMRLKGFYFDALGPSRAGEFASDVILAIPNKHTKRLQLMIAENFKASPSTFDGEGVTFISAQTGHNDQSFDPLLIENIGQSITQVQDFSNLLQKKVWTINNDYLKLPLLFARIQEQKQLLKDAKRRNEGRQILKEITKQMNRSFSEIAKRVSIATAVFTFTLMGAAFGLRIGRNRSYLPLFYAIVLTSFFLITFFIAKAFEQQHTVAITLFTVPHLIIITASLSYIRRTAKGIE